MSDISRVNIPDKYYFDPETNVGVGKDSAFVYW